MAGSGIVSLPDLSTATRAAAGDREKALAIAEAASRAAAAGFTRGRRSFIRIESSPALAKDVADGPLTGCVFSVKDNIDVAGQVTTCGSRVLEDAPPAAADAWIVDALKRVGAICIGKNTLHEFALGATGKNLRFGNTPNPYDKTRHVGGSSGGSTIAVADGEVHLAIGTDSGGSVRMPASFAGITGYKPTPGILPMHGVAGASWSMDCLGLLTRTAREMRLVWDALVPSSPREPSRKPRIAYLQDFSMGRVSAPVWSRYTATVERLRESGYDLHGVSIPGLDICPQICISVVYPEVASAHFELMRARPERYEQDIRALVALGELWSGRHYLDAQRARTVVRARLEDAIAGHDFLLTPSVAIQPLHFDETARVEGDPPGSALYPIMRFTVPFNVVSYPGISVHSGLDGDGLPVGLQVVARPRQDDALLALAAEIEARLA
jgi:aspartyl-tRNA(Asn)/glutamyl-tRNA(Gln) amidotransferase subunit A